MTIQSIVQTGLAVIAVAAIGGAATSSALNEEWYADLTKPAWQPPSPVFGPVWTFLYVLVAIAGGVVLSAYGWVSRPMLLWIAQLVLTLGWSLVFFGLQSIGGALVVIAALWVSLVAFMFAAWPVGRIASLLFAPYLAWVTFASLLNAAIWLTN